MNPLLIKIARLTFLGVLPLFLTSSTGNNIKLRAPLEQGTHTIIITGAQTQELTGRIKFETITPYGKESKKNNLLKLCFIGEGDAAVYTMELLVSKAGDTNGVSVGNYKVAQVDSFLSPFDGVFGAFSSDEFGNKPFFASDGIVRIVRYDETRAIGVLDLRFKDCSGNRFSIAGAFDAR